MMSSPSTNETIPMDNTGNGPLQVPGFGGIPIDHILEWNNRFVHGANDWNQVPAVTAREFAMVEVMNNLTDKPDWQVKIFNDHIVAKWREEAFATTPLMSEGAWAWCLSELHDKAVDFKEKQYIRVLDTGSCICKSDTLVPEFLSSEFKSGVAPLLDELEKDSRPGNYMQMRNLIDPSLFPLVYGRSLVLQDGGKTNLDTDGYGSYRQATVAPTHFDKRVSRSNIQTQLERGLWHPQILEIKRKEISFYNWSYNFQWLPCEVEFLEDSGTEVKITSYINNLHPTHKSLYKSIEKLISLTIKPWNDCLIKAQRNWTTGYRGGENGFNGGQRGPVPLRIITYGVEWIHELPEWALAFHFPLPTRLKEYLETKEISEKKVKKKDVEGVFKLWEAQKKLKSMEDMKGRENMPRPTKELWQMAKEYLELPEPKSPGPKPLPEDWAKDEATTLRYLRQKQRNLFEFRLPEPGIAFSYEDWKSGKNNKAVVEMHRGAYPEHFPEDQLLITAEHKPYTVALQDDFRKQGIQIIVKIHGIDLTPAEPYYGGGEWKLEGQLNEHIVAIAIYPYDVKNVTEARISFRQETPIPERFYRYGMDRFMKDFNFYNPIHLHRRMSRRREIEVLAQIFGFQGEDFMKDNGHPERDEKLPFQNIGSVCTRQGRLITFPNAIEHRFESFELVDHQLPGHRRSIVLYLVDPHYRVCSTRNVPPQQSHWWAEGVSKELFKLGVPKEISTMITDQTDDWLMGMDEARNHRKDKIKEQNWMDAARYSRIPTYGFVTD